MKKIIAGIMAIALVFGSAALPVSDFNDNSVISAYAYAGEDDCYYSGDWEYILNEDDTACITSYFGEYSSDVVLYIPSELDGHIVTSLGDFYFETDVSEIHIPSSIKYIAPTSFYNPFKNAEYCEAEYVVDPDNDVYASKDGFLYSKDMKTIFAGPITDILSISSEIETISPYIYPLVQTAFDVDSNNNVYTSEDGILYRKDMKTLLACPKAKSGELFIPEGVETIGENNLNISSYDEFLIDTYGAFSYCDNIDVVFPSTLKSIESYAFYFTNLSNCNIEIPNGVTYIGDYAFCIKPLVSSMFNDKVYITIPESIKNIGNYAFNPVNNDKLFIYCYSGSTAEQYAIDNGFDYATISKPIDENMPYLLNLTYSQAREKLAQTDEVRYEYFKETVDKNTGNTTIELYQQCPDFTPNGDPIMLDNGFLYGLTKDGSAIIYGYVGDDTDISIPEEIKGTKVTTLQYAYMSESYEFDKDGNQIRNGGGIQQQFITKSSDTSLNIIIPSTITDLATVFSQDNLKLFCEEGSPAAQALTTNGVDFTKYDKNSSDTESSENSQNDTNTSSQADTASKATSNSNKTNTSSTANPNTGAAAGLSLAALVGAAVVVTKRKK